jgi:hypothetical protein
MTPLNSTLDYECTAKRNDAPSLMRCIRTWGEMKRGDFHSANHKTSTSHLPSKPQVSKGVW